jgi:translation initiation factor IF-3
MALRPPSGRFRVVEEPYKINERITAKEVRLVGENIEAGVVDIATARAIAKTQNLDLVEIAPTAVPPVCKVVDYSKFKYEQKKKQKEIKAKAMKVVIKEIRFGPNTDDHDFDFKLKHAINFLKEGSKVKAYERGVNLLNKFSEALSEYGKVEMEPKLEGKRMTIILAPLPPKK